MTNNQKKKEKHKRKQKKKRKEKEQRTLKSKENRKKRQQGKKRRRRRRRRRGGNVQVEGKKKRQLPGGKKKGEEEQCMDKAHVQVHKAFLSIKQPHFLPLVFSLFLGKNFLIGSGRKHLDPTIYFPFSPLNQTHSKNVFLPIFSSKFFIYPISPPNKHTLSVIDQK